jgi:phosphoribosylformylglycinamidine synthase
MAHRIEVAFRPEFVDALARSIRDHIASDLRLPARDVRTVDVYTLDASLTPEELQLLGEELFANPVVQLYSIDPDEPLAKGLPWDWLIEVGYRPGVTDTVGETARAAVRDLLGVDVPAYSSKQYLIRGDLRERDTHHIATDLLANELIERFSIYDRRRWDGHFRIVIPAVDLDHEPSVEIIDLSVSDEELQRISRERLLALDSREMRAVRDYFRSRRAERENVGLPPNPTDVELEALAQNWSEHCKHKIFRGLIEYRDEEVGTTYEIDGIFKTYIQGATEEIRKQSPYWRGALVSVFVDNAGVVKLDDEINVVFKVETHNSPSALDPYGGALTGIVGVNRDALGTGRGARLLFNTDIFCFAPPDYENPLPKGLKHPRRVFEGVRRGVEHGGNKSGVPTVNGTIRFDERYLGKPLVYCGTGGIMPAEIDSEPSHEKEIQPGDLIVVVGGRIGADGIHGATFSSEALTEASPTSAVQIGNPFVQKVMVDMLLEARDLGLYRTIHDNGAGGLSVSVAELAEKCGGAELHLDRAPLKYPGLDPWQILVSESQERMTLAVPPDKVKEFLELARRREVEVTVLGEFTNTGMFHVLYEGKTIAYVDIEFLVNGAPRKRMKAVWKRPRHEEPNLPEPRDLSETLHKMLGQLNICSKESVVRQYDHEVQAATVVKPMVGLRDDGPSDAAVLWPLEMQRKGSSRGIVVANGINPNYGDIDTYHMAALALDEAVRNAVAVGANPDKIAVLDNFCWSSSDDEFRLAQLVRACKALYEYAVAFGTPFISGKDSMYNDFVGELNGETIKISVPPTILISALGIIDDVEKAVTMDLKEPGNLLYLLGETCEELGASEYFALMGKELRGEPFLGNCAPQVDASSAKVRYSLLHRAISEGWVRSCHDPSEGGLGVALAEMAFAGGLGLNIDLQKVPGADLFERDDHLLFAESASRLLVEVRPEHKERFERLFEGTACALIGEVTEEPALRIAGLQGRVILCEDLEALKTSWQRTLGSMV